MKRNILIILLFAALVAMTALCYFTNDNRTTNGRAYIEQARVTFHQSCSMCHGTHGEGNGPTARALPVKPPNWTNPRWQSAVTNQGIQHAITGGGASIGRSDFMPPNPHLADAPVLAGLVELIREFGRR